MALKKAKREMAYGKVGVFGFAGTGKTYSTANFAIGLHKFIQSKGPVAMYDTETGSDFLIGRYEQEGIEFLTEKSRSFVDLMKFMDDAEKAGSQIIIIDSITHVWLELQSSYLAHCKKRKPNMTKLGFPEWAFIKGEWSKFTDRFLTSKMHIFLCGRAKYEYEHFENEEGKKEINKVGTTMKAEGDFSYEPSLLLELRRIRPNDEHYIEERGIAGQVKKLANVNTKWLHVAEVNKDRTDTINGSTLVFPTFDDILPHFKNLNLGGEHAPLDTASNSKASFPKETMPLSNGKNERTIVLEEITAEIITQCGSTRSSSVQQCKVDLMRQVFGTGSWTQVTVLKLEALQDGLRIMRQKRYDAAVKHQVPKAAPNEQTEIKQ